MTVKESKIIIEASFDKDFTAPKLEACRTLANDVIDVIEATRIAAFPWAKEDAMIEIKNNVKTNSQNDLLSITISGEKLTHVIVHMMKNGKGDLVAFRRIPLDTNEDRDSFFVDMNEVSNIHRDILILRNLAEEKLPEYIYVQEARMEQVILWNKPLLETQLTSLFFVKDHESVVT